MAGREGETQVTVCDERARCLSGDSDDDFGASESGSGGGESEGGLAVENLIPV